MQRLIEYAAMHPYLVALSVLLGLGVLVNELWLRAQNLAALAPQEVVRLMNSGATLLDLRDAPAFAAGHISGARHFDAAQLARAADALKRYKERALIVYGEQGAAGANAVRALAKQGFTQVYNLRGGVAAWRSEHLPLAKD